MTNAMIIFTESLKLMGEGLLGTTGRTILVDGKEYPEPEAIHTYAKWKELGYQVQKGQKAIAQFTIWKFASKENEDPDKAENKIFMKRASFFKAAQVERAGA